MGSGTRRSTQCSVQRQATSNKQRATKRRLSSKQYSCSRFIVLALRLATCYLRLATCRSITNCKMLRACQPRTVTCHVRQQQYKHKGSHVATDLPHLHSLQLIQLYSWSTSKNKGGNGDSVQRQLLYIIISYQTV